MLLICLKYAGVLVLGYILFMAFICTVDFCYIAIKTLFEMAKIKKAHNAKMRAKKSL